MSQVGWYALRMAGEISGLGIRKNYGESLWFLPEFSGCNTVNPDRDFVFLGKRGIITADHSYAGGGGLREEGEYGNQSGAS